MRTTMPFTGSHIVRRIINALRRLVGRPPR